MASKKPEMQEENVGVYMSIKREVSEMLDKRGLLLKMQPLTTWSQRYR
jgi:hypothetical protein